MDELVTWLRAQIDEDELRARRADKRAVATWIPDRVLAEVNAKRRIADECVRTLEFEDYGLPLADHVLRLLALSYADRPGYREEWRP